MSENFCDDDPHEAEGRMTERRARQALPILLSGKDAHWELESCESEEHIERRPKHINEGRRVQTMTIVAVEKYARSEE